MACSGREKSMWRILVFYLFYTLLSVYFASATGEKETACNNIDIRNSVKNFYKLDNCTVVEGFLKIVLIDKASPQDYSNISFPKLTEITGYLLLFRASGLVSLANMFPNLAVIRGDDLFHNFAIVIYEMFHLQEIGLGSLTDVLRGSLFIMKNRNLCYLETIDWSRILRAEREHNAIRLNKDPDQCPNTCPNHCAKDPFCRHGSISGDINCRLCWNKHTCQKVCSEDCNAKNSTCMIKDARICCARECLGGCKGNGADQCIACRHVVYQNRCREKCPQGTYEFKKRRCLIEQECKNISSSLGESPQDRVYWKLHDNQCLKACPPGETESESDRHKCEKCKDKCPKVCNGLSIDNVERAQSLKGCTTIGGSLIIQVKGGANIIRELEENLQSIVEITGYLKISRSFPLISLNFLKNLETIGGESLDREKYSFLVMDNQNLQELWDWKVRQKKLVIKKGNIFFHFNAKLCYNKITYFQEEILGRNKTDLESIDVSPLSNGDRIACDVANLTFKVSKRGPNMAVFEWENYRNKMSDRRSLLGYVIHIKEAPFKNVSIFDGRDACGSDVWKIYDVGPMDGLFPNQDSSSVMKVNGSENVGYKNEQLYIMHLITELKPYTQYAAYVRTYTVLMEKQGARSDILYFRTRTHTPSPPTQLRTFSKSPNKVTIVWKPPKDPRGIVTNYKVVVTKQIDSQEYINQRDYCQEARHHLNTKKQTTLESADVPSNPIINAAVKSVNFNQSSSADCCACNEKSPELEKEEEFANMIITLEDYLHNNIYIKNPNAGTSSGSSNRTITTRSVNERSTRSQTFPITTTAPASTAKESTTSSSTTIEPTTVTSSNTSDSAPQSTSMFKIVPVSATDFLNKDQIMTDIENLTHYTEYSITIQACQDRTEDHDLNPHPLCSSYAIDSIRTLPLDGADSILDSSTIVKKENVSEGSIFIKWDEPISPNGLIVSYQLEYTPVDDKLKVRVQCVPQSNYSELHGAILKAEAGIVFRLRVRATSMAGEGNWTTPIEFEIEKSAQDTASHIFLSVLGVVLVILSVVLISGLYIYKKKYMATIPAGILYASVNPEYMSTGLVYEPDEWEVPREKITLIRELGQGSFGMVYEGRAVDAFHGESELRCAIKTVNESASLREQIEFLQEASVMKAFNCHHVVKLLGVVSKGSPTLVVMELMANGDLKSFLRSLRPEAENNLQQPPTLKEIFQMAIEIADGMAYLSAKKFVHRDLAARNCMVDHYMTVKIGDFGMTRDIYETDYYRKGGKGLLPVRWMAPESLKDGVFTNQSDVWSYGVVLWEMATLSSQPYQGLSNEQVLKYVISGGFMEMPENCPGKLYALMKLCWEKNPKARPTFVELIEFLLPDVSTTDFQVRSFYFDQRAQICSSNKLEEDDAETATPTTPLKAGLNTRRRNIGSREALNNDPESIQYFPSVTSAPELRNNLKNDSETVLMDSINGGCVNCGRTCNGSCQAVITMDTASALLTEEGNAVRVVSSNNGSKGMSLPSSEGSKVSSLSNGSLANGHIHFASGRTTTC